MSGVLIYFKHRVKESDQEYREGSIREAGRIRKALVFCDMVGGLVVVGIRFTPGVVSSFNDSIAWDNTSPCDFVRVQSRRGEIQRGTEGDRALGLLSLDHDDWFSFSLLTSWIKCKISTRGHDLEGGLHWRVGGCFLVRLRI